MLPTLSDSLARSVIIPDPEVHEASERVMLTRPALRVPLSANPALTPTAWAALYKRPSLEVALNLTARPLEMSQRLHVLKTETRERPLFNLVEFNELTDEEIERLAGSKACKARLATKLITQLGGRNPGLSRELALKAGEVTLLEWLASADDVDADSARSLIEMFPSWAPKKSYRTRATLLGNILERFPSALAAYVAPGQDLSAVTAAAGSRFLTDPDLQRLAAGTTQDLGPVQIQERKYALLALVNNPPTVDDVLDEVLVMVKGHLDDVTSSVTARRAKDRPAVTEPYETVSDADVLEWLVWRSLPSEYKPLGRPFDLAALAVNPNLPPHLRTRVVTALSYPSFTEVLGSRTESLWDEIIRLDPSSESYRPEPYERVREDDDSVWDFVPASERTATSAEVTAVENAHVRSLTWFRESDFVALGVLLTSALGSNEESWDTFLSLLEEFDGTFKDLTEISAGL